jgi:hypothetical protein
LTILSFNYECEVASGLRLALLALGHDGGTKAGSEVVWKFVKLGAAVDLDCAFCCVANNVAVVAPKKVLV